jgi:MerR family transcriptional regulator/heat shock protein HspR/chaperone modulatory protein CbpM
MSDVSLSTTVVSAEGDRLYSFEQAAHFTQTSVTLVERLVALELVQSENQMLRSQELERIAKILRLRRDLGLNLVGAGMVLELTQEIAQLKARLKAYQQGLY